MNSKYKVLIGLEMHCEISETNTKVFSGAKNEYSEEANSNVVPIDMAFPGVLPLINKEAVKKALMASIMLNCKQPEYVYFERKNYYYPDLPKGFQLTQETKPCPIGIYGNVTYFSKGEKKIAYIDNIHLEEDAASLDHYSTYSTINYNRAGVPLLELVTTPCFHDAEETVDFLRMMRLIYRYSNISEADSKKGHIRCDVNISIMEADKDENDPKNYGTRVEIKNVNSFGGVRDSINYEIKRQIELKENGQYEKMEQQTRRWDEENQETVYMRNKVDAIDYRYFIEPNIPKYKITTNFIEDVKKKIPVLPNTKYDKYLNEYELDIKEVESLIREKNISDYFDEVINLGITPKEASKWISVVIIGSMNKLESDLEELGITPQMLSNVIKLVVNNKLSMTNGKNALHKAIETKKDPIQIIEEDNLMQVDDDAILIKYINEVLDTNLDVVEQFKSGKEQLVNYLVGKVLKLSKGQANPKKTLDLLNIEIRKR